MGEQQLEIEKNVNCSSIKSSVEKEIDNEKEKEKEVAPTIDQVTDKYVKRRRSTRATKSNGLQTKQESIHTDLTGNKVGNNGRTHAPKRRRSSRGAALLKNPEPKLEHRGVRENRNCRLMRMNCMLNKLKQFQNEF